MKNVKNLELVHLMARWKMIGKEYWVMSMKWSTY